MSSVTYQGKVINGTIELPADVQLPENSHVLVVVTDETEPIDLISTPRLAHPEQAKDFVMEVEVLPDASL